MTSTVSDKSSHHLTNTDTEHQSPSRSTTKLVTYSDEDIYSRLIKPGHPYPETNDIPVTLSSLQHWCLPNDQILEYERECFAKKELSKVLRLNNFMLFRNAAVARSGFEHNGSAVSTLAGLLWQRLPAEVKAQWKVESIALERRAKEYLSMQPMSRRPGVKRNPHLPSRNTISLTDQDTESSLTHPPMLVPSMTYLTTTPSSSLQPYYNRAITFPTASVTYNPKRDAFSPPPRPRAPSPTQSKHHPSQFTTSSPDPSIAFQSLMLGNFRTSTPTHMFDNAERPPIKIPTLPSQVEYGLGGFTPTTYFSRGTTPACSPVPTLLSCNSSAPSSSFSTPYLPCYPPSMLSINNESDALLYNSYQEMLTNSVGLGLELTLNTIPKAFPNIIFTPIPTYATNFNPNPFPNLNFIFNELSSEHDGSAINQSQPTMTGSSAFPSDELDGLTEHWDETMSRL